MSEHARQKSGDTYIRGSILGDEIHEARHREFGNIELLELECPVECLLWSHWRADDFAPFDPYFFLEYRPRTIVIDAGKAKLKTGHGDGSGIVGILVKDLEFKSFEGSRSDISAAPETKILSATADPFHRRGIEQKWDTPPPTPEINYAKKF